MFLRIEFDRHAGYNSSLNIPKKAFVTLDNAITAAGSSERSVSTEVYEVTDTGDLVLVALWAPEEDSAAVAGDRLGISPVSEAVLELEGTGPWHVELFSQLNAASS